MKPYSRTWTESTGLRLLRTGVLPAALLAGCAVLPPAGVSPPSAGTEGPAAATPVPSLGFFSRIKVPEGHVPVLKLAGRGVQIFRCEQRERTLGWAYRLPEADLLDSEGRLAGRHGADFSFELNDGSRLVGKVQGSDEVSANDLRWLLLSTRSFGQGALTGITYVQRINTHGGMPPARCEANQRNQLLRVDFSAEFVFYRPG
jgi:hypothetical protein